MSTRDPGSRFWRKGRGVVVVPFIIWTVCAAVAAVAGFLLAQPETFDKDALGGMEPAPFLWLAGAFVLGLLGMFVCVFGIPGREGAMAARYDMLRWLSATGVGVGLGAAMAMTGDHGDTVLTWMLPCLVVGALVFACPWLIERTLAGRRRHRDWFKWNGAGAPGEVTGVFEFTEDEYIPRYRATIRFTDTTGTQRWFKRLAPREVRGVRKGQKVMVWFDPDHPDRKRSIEVGWDNATAQRTSRPGQSRWR